MREFDTYIFDLDDMLLSTSNDLAVNTNCTLCWARMLERTVEEIRIFVENGIKLLMGRAIPNGTNNPKSEETYARSRKHHSKHNLDITNPHDGISESLRGLKRRGKKLAVVSNRFHAATQGLVKHLFLDTIKVTIGERETVRKKPAPDTVLKTLRQLGVSKEGAVYIGDGDVDIITVKDCGLPYTSVLWGFRDKDFLIQHDGTTSVDKPSEVLGG